MRVKKKTINLQCSQRRQPIKCHRAKPFYFIILKMPTTEYQKISQIHTQADLECERKSVTVNSYLLQCHCFKIYGPAYYKYITLNY